MALAENGRAPRQPSAFFSSDSCSSTQVCGASPQYSTTASHSSSLRRLSFCRLLAAVLPATGSLTSKPASKRESRRASAGRVGESRGLSS